MLMRYRCDVDLVWGRAFGPHYVNVPRVPGLGLLLERPFFAGYNKKVERLNSGHEKVDVEPIIVKKISVGDSIGKSERV